MVSGSHSAPYATVRGGLELATLGAQPASGKELARFLTRESGEDVVDHTAFDVLLHKFARRFGDGIVRVNYQAWTRVAADRVALRRYIDAVAAVEPSRLGQAEQFAFWANLYNAVVLNLVLQHTPVSSIRDIPAMRGTSGGPWKRPLVQVGGVALSLDDIEHGILRRRWRGPHVHYALSCATLGGPNLPLRAWRGADLALALDAAARAFVNHPRGVRAEGGDLVVSSIYKWYAADFPRAGRGLLTHLAALAEPALRLRLQGARRPSRYAYDWSLNVETEA